MLLAAAVLAGCGSLHHYAPGVVDDTLAGVLTFGPQAPNGAYRLGGGPGSSPRGCRTSSNGAGREATAAPGVRFACEEDFDAYGTADYIAAGYQVSAAQDQCWQATLSYVFFVRRDRHGPSPDLASIPLIVAGCGLPIV